jgi:hypothetical protein
MFKSNVELDSDLIERASLAAFGTKSVGSSDAATVRDILELIANTFSSDVTLENYNAKRSEKESAIEQALISINSAAYAALESLGISISDIPTSVVLKVKLLIAKTEHIKSMSREQLQVLTRIAEDLMPVGSYSELESCPSIVLKHFNDLKNAYLEKIPLLTKEAS